MSIFNSSILERAKTLTTAGVSELLTKGEKSLSIPVLEQRIAQLSESRKALQASLAECTYRVNSAKANLEAHRKTDEEIEGKIRRLMEANGNQPTSDQKMAAQRFAVGLRELRSHYSQEEATIESLQQQHDEIDKNLSALIEREKDYRSQIQTLKMQAASTKSLSQAARAAEHAGAVMNALDSASGLAESIGIEHAKASAAFSSAMGEMTRPDDEIEKMETDDLIASIMAKPNVKSAA